MKKMKYTPGTKVNVTFTLSGTVDDDGDILYRDHPFGSHYYLYQDEFGFENVTIEVVSEPEPELGQYALIKTPLSYWFKYGDGYRNLFDDSLTMKWHQLNQPLRVVYEGEK